jgi:Protein of unknown function (DUF3300)
MTYNAGLRLFRSVARCSAAFLCSLLLLPGDGLSVAAGRRTSQEKQLPDTPAPNAQNDQDQPAPKLPSDQLDSLVAPIALYPDPMLAQVLAASTYPLEIIQLQQWLAKNPNLKDKALADAVAKQPWDPSIQGMAAMPELVKRLADDIQWTTDLGNAFLAQENDVMDAVQRMRKKAEGAGNLKSTEQQKVETKVVETKEVIIIQQADPQVVYVPSYNPVVVYGPPVYPYPPIYYPPPGYYAAGVAISFGVGLAMGAAWGGGWGYGCGWGGNNNITINNNNNFNRNTNVNGGNRVNHNGSRGGAGGNNWQHNPSHRGGTPYSDRSTANKYGGTSRGSSVSDRQSNARQNQGNAGNRGQSGARPSQGNVGGGDRGGGNRPSAGTSDLGGNRGGSSGASNRGSSTALGGGSSGKSGSSARASSSRGSSSMSRSSGGSRGGGGGRRR